MIGRENLVTVLDAVVVWINQYLKNNKEKIIKNESGRSDDIETLITNIYDCFDKRMSDVVDSVLSQQNLQQNIPDEFPLPNTLLSHAANNFSECYEKAMTDIRNHKYRTGSIFRTTGKSELKEGIELAIQNAVMLMQNNIRDQCLLQSLTYADEDTRVAVKLTSTFFNSKIQRDSFILFYTDDPINSNIYFVSPLLTERLSVCFKSKNFLDGKTSLELKRDSYGVAIGQSIKSVFAAAALQPTRAKVARCYYCYHASLPLQQIRKLAAEKSFTDILRCIDGLQVWVNNTNNINEIANFSVSYQDANNKFIVNEMLKDTIIKKV